MKYGNCDRYQAEGIVISRCTRRSLTSSSSTSTTEVSFSIDFARKGPIEIKLSYCLGEIDSIQRHAVITGIHGNYELSWSHLRTCETGYSLTGIVAKTEVISLGLTQLLFELLLPYETIGKTKSFISESIFIPGELSEDVRTGTLLLESKNDAREVNSMRIRKDDTELLYYGRKCHVRLRDVERTLDLLGEKYNALAKERVRGIDRFNTTYEFKYTTSH